MIFILASSFLQAREWAKNQGLERADWVFADRAEFARGYLRGSCSYVRLEGSHRHPHSHEIMECIADREFKEVASG